jgi:hypothetical protein
MQIANELLAKQNNIQSLGQQKSPFYKELFCNQKQIKIII